MSARRSALGVRVASRVRRVYHRLPLPDGAKWKLKKVFLLATGSLLKDTDTYRTYLEQERVRRLGIPFLASGNRLPLLRPLPKPDVLLWGIIDWHFRRQRPQHLAEQLKAQGHRVFLVSPTFEGHSSAGFRTESLDDEQQLFNVHLHAARNPVIYAGPPGARHVRQLRQSLAALLAWSGSSEYISIVQHPFWFEIARVVPNARLVYDCMDDHAGFETHEVSFEAVENALFRQADLVVATSEALERRAANLNPNVLRLPNACDYEFLSRPPAERFRPSEQGRKVVGYIGAIAEWFDVDLVEALLRRHPEILVVLVGTDTCGAEKRLAAHDNVRFIGEIPYEEVPYYLHGFDVALIPFRITPLTTATNPVKAFEYLAAGKPVVSTPLPELIRFADLITVAGDRSSFLEEVRKLVAEGTPARFAEDARKFASEQTWQRRAEELGGALSTLAVPKVSVIVVTYKQLSCTKHCIESLLGSTAYSNMEIIAVDNASQDGTVEYLEQVERLGADLHLIANSENRGFAAACNQGLGAATGDYLVVLNNDTVVTPGWVTGLMRHLRADATIGLIGPITNNIGNEARVAIKYRNAMEMPGEVRRLTLEGLGRLHAMKTLGFFCVMMPRAVFESVGGLDERFGLGYFEDDDYCRRVLKAGFRICYAEDVFVHHHLSASFSALPLEERHALFLKNKALFEEKWGRWQPHRYG